MNKRDHVVNAAGLGVTIGVVTSPVLSPETAIDVLSVTLPVVLGALFPDVDGTIGRHRKTFHNLPVLILFTVWPQIFGNLYYVWIGIAAHYVLDIVGSRRGIALFFPYEKEYGLPYGVSVVSRYSSIVTILITIVESSVIAWAFLIWI